MGVRDCRENPASASPAVRSVRILLKRREALPPSGGAEGARAGLWGAFLWGHVLALGPLQSTARPPCRGQGTRKPPVRGRGLGPRPHCPRRPSPCASGVHRGGHLASAGQAMEGSSRDIPTFFNFSLNLAIRSSWSEPQSAPGLVFADCTELLHLWLQRI